MSFGFGVGDILVVSNGVLKFWTTVRDASTEQEDLRKNLEILRQVVERITERAGILRPKLSPPIAIALGQQLSQCSKHLRNLDNIVAKYMGDFSPRGPHRKRRHRVIAWGAFKRDEFVESLNNLGKVILLLVSYAMFEGLDNKLPLAVQDTSDCQTIRLIDALDRESGFEDFLKFNFNRSFGKSWVEAGRYKIRDETAGGGGILTAKEWNNSIKAGMTVSMAMVLRKQVVANETEHNCPACNSPYTGPKSNDLERVQCKKCATFFQVSSEPRVVELPDDVTDQGSLSSSTGNAKHMNSSEVVDMDEIQYFRRLHVLNELIISSFE
ncbi:hypothetical protein Q9L58_005874, partial [Maublancomyces gigas]